MLIKHLCACTHTFFLATATPGSSRMKGYYLAVDLHFRGEVNCSHNKANSISLLWHCSSPINCFYQWGYSPVQWWIVDEGVELRQPLPYDLTKSLHSKSPLIVNNRLLLSLLEPRMHFMTLAILLCWISKNVPPCGEIMYLLCLCLLPIQEWICVLL